MITFKLAYREGISVIGRYTTCRVFHVSHSRDGRGQVVLWGARDSQDVERWKSGDFS